MPIKVTCACGQSFAAKDELAGRTVKCPKCSRPLVIPAAGAGGLVPLAPPPGVPQPNMAQPSAPQPALSAAAPAPAVGGLFDEIGLSSAPAGTQPCPACRKPIPMHAVVCVECGYNLKLGRRMETVKIGADGQVEGGSVTDMILARAAQTIEDDKEEERKKVREGMPWWGYLLMLLGLIGFMAMMMMIPQGNAIRVAGSVVVFVGWAICMYSGIAILVIAFRESPLQGILYLLVPFYPLVYIIIRWDQCAGLFFMNLGGTVIIFLGIGAWFLAGMIGGNEPTVLLPGIQHALALAQSRGWGFVSLATLATQGLRPW